ncbi:MAG: hypothetical protein H8E66_06870 [Planctomycetes bacterium]|nr:hypothetical protein [Planctomycetota bacterium]
MLPTITDNLEHFALDGPFGLPIAVVIGVVLLALFAWALSRERSVIGKRNAMFFWVLRAVAVGVVIWMLLAPTTVSVQRSTTRRAVAVVTDVSRSMATVDPQGTSDDLRWALAGASAPDTSTEAADRALAAAGIAERHLHSAAQAQREHRAESRVRDATTAARDAIEHIRANVSTVLDRRNRWEAAGNADGAESSLAKRIQKMLDGPDFQAFTELARALERGRAPSQKGWRESLPDLEHRVAGIQRRLAELARTVSEGEQQLLKNENAEAFASIAQASRLSRVGLFVESLKDSVLGPVSDQADVRYSVFDETLTSLSNQESPEIEIKRQRKQEPQADDKTGLVTDLSAVLEQISRARQQQPIAAVIIPTDVIHNSTNSPHPRELAAELDGTPIYIVPIGNTRHVRDIILQSVLAPNIAMRNDDMVIEASLQAYDCEGEICTVELLQDGEVIDSEDVAFDSAVATRTVRFEQRMAEVGVHQYQVSVAPLDSELSDENNFDQFEVNVTRGEIKVLLADELPRWEYGYLTRLFRRAPKIECDELLFRPRVIATGRRAESQGFWAPTVAITATQLDSVTGDAAIPRGQSIDIVTKLTGMTRDAATLTLVTGADETSTIVLDADRDAPEKFSHFVAVDESFRYRVSAGDGRTRWHSITAIDPPEISEVHLAVTAPDYVDRAPYEKSLLPGRVKAIEGSRLTLEMRSEAELERFELLLSSDDESGEPVAQMLVLTAEADGWYRYETVLEKDLALSPTLHSPYGLTNEDQRICRIRVIPDKAPVARVISPTDEMSVSADEVLDIKFEAHDDHGIAKVELVVYEEDENGEQRVLSVQEIPIDEQQLEKHILGEVQLDLSKFELDEGTNISYSIRVTDNRMLDLDPADVAARKDKAGESAEGDKEKDPSAIAKSSESKEAKEEGDSPDATATAQTDGSSETESSAEASPDKAQMAKSDATAGSRKPGSEEPASDETASTGTDPKEKAGPTESVAESGKEGLKVGEDEEKPGETAITKSRAEGEKNESETSDPTVPKDPAAVAANKGDGPMSNENADPTGDQVAASKSKHSTEANPDDPEGDDSSESPVVAARSAKTPEGEANEKTSPSGGSPNLQTPNDEDPELANSDNTSSQNSQPGEAPQKSNDPANPDAEQPDSDRKSSGSVQLTETSQGGSPTPTPPLDLDRDMQFESQRGQNTESNRRRLKITERLAVVAEAGKSRQTDTMNTRKLLEKIDKELEAAETTLTELNGQTDLGALAEKPEQVDASLETAGLVVADLRKSSNETKYEFVGLQMLDIDRTHVTPARDRMFVLIQDPGSTPARNVLEALHHTSAAREALAALMKQFEEVARERELAEALEEAAKMYEVYVENMRGVLREAQKNQNPLTRKMAVVEVEEAYLDRLTQVLEMEREIMAEFARILAEDPRLMGKYMDIIKRRDGNLRNRLTDLRELQEEISYEVSGWLRVDEAQRPDVWIQVAEMRLLAVKDLVKAASQLEARTLSQLPLNLEPTAGIGATVVKHAKEVALKARQSSLKAKKLMSNALEDDQAKIDLAKVADELKHELTEMDAVLERLAFEHEDDEEVIDFTTNRLAESRGVAELAIAWAEVAEHVRHERFHGLAAVDQLQLAVDTDRLRIDMAEIEGDLTGLFQPDDPPAEVTNIVRELMMIMETITFNQAAAAFELNHARFNEAEAQQTMSNEAFERAEELFDKMRRTTADILDEREVRDPNVADLEDPSLDEFLEQLEREPNLNQLLGIPNRPQNLRVIRDWMLWQAQGSGGGGGSPQQAVTNAMQRAQMMAQRRTKNDDDQRAPGDQPLTEEELKRFANAEDMEEDMETMLRAIEEKMKDPATGDEQREEMQKKAEMLAQMLEEARSGGLNREKWEELANADEMRAMMEALAAGEPIPDSTWNRVLSTLDAGLWQVRGRTPPEDYRKQIEQYQDLLRRFVDEESINAN